MATHVISTARRALGLLAGVLVSLSVCASIDACIWDEDTLAMENQRFPTALELICGKFLRHSPEFYEWRVADREQRLADNLSPQLFDDLAVAYEKLGDHDKAIEVMLRKQEHFPGLYETHANLGTFYIHAGQLERGLRQIDIALAINPDAHFGREIYQKHLVNYVLSKRADGTTTLPLDESARGQFEPAGFFRYVLEVSSVGDAANVENDETEKTLKGVLGMMRFGNHESPILLEALGDVLLSRGQSGDAKQLAARAYLKAAYESEDAASRRAYRRLAQESLSMQVAAKSTATELSLQELERQFSGELAQANRWFQAVADDESKWISQGINVDEAFKRKYYEEPLMTSPADLAPTRNRLLWVLVAGGLAMTVLCSAWVLLRRSTAERSD